MAKVNLDEYTLKERIVLLQEADQLLSILQSKIDDQTRYLEDEAPTVSGLEKKLSELSPEESGYYSAECELKWARERLEDYSTRKRMLLMLQEIIKKTV